MNSTHMNLYTFIIRLHNFVSTPLFQNMSFYNQKKMFHNIHHLHTFQRWFSIVFFSNFIIISYFIYLSSLFLSIFLFKFITTKTVNIWKCIKETSYKRFSYFQRILILISLTKNDKYFESEQVLLLHAFLGSIPRSNNATYNVWCSYFNFEIH